jgi:hypothetical protein
LGHSSDHGSATTAGYIHRRITTIARAVLDLALGSNAQKSEHA